MKKNEIKIGEKYLAKVSDKVVEVRIDSENRHGGWDATNLATGKSIRIKSAQRLRGKVRAATRAIPEPAGQTPGELGVAAARADAKAAGKKKTAKREAGESKPKRVSALDAAAQVLKDAGQPMRTKEMIEAMTTQGLWASPKGKTPEATLYSAILREIGTKGDAARFRKIERGQFAFAGRE